MTSAPPLQTAPAYTADEPQAISGTLSSLGSRLRSLAPPLMVTAMVCLLTLISFRTAQDLELERDTARATSAARDLAQLLEQRLHANEAVLLGVTGALALAPEMTRAEFQDYIDRLDLATNFPGLFGVGWSVVVAPDEVANLVASQRAQGFPDFNIWPEPGPAALPQEPLHTIRYLEPMNDRNAAAIGYNMYTEERRRSAMQKAAQTGKATASARLELVQEISDDKQAGFLLYLPIYEGQEQQSDVSARELNLKGFIYGVFRMNNFMHVTLPESRLRSLDFAIYDGDILPENLMFDSRDSTLTSARLEQPVIQPIQFGTRTWSLLVERGDLVLRDDDIRLRSIILAAGLLLATLLGVLTWLITKRREEVEHALAQAEEQNRIRVILLRELNHRVKNSLATVLSMASLTRRYASSIDDYYEAFSLRVTALSGAHDLLTQSNWTDASFRELIKAELGPYLLAGNERVAISGPRIRLRPASAMSFGLALHELATNAAKYGALSVPDGRVSIDWTIEGEEGARYIHLLWKEQGGPPVTQPTRKGFGTTLLQRLTARELSGNVELLYDPDGIRCTMQMDYSKVSISHVL